MFIPWLYCEQEVVTADDVIERYSMSADDEINTTMTSSSVSKDGSLLMRSVDITDDGKYVCSISNNLGATETTVQFEVLGITRLTYLFIMMGTMSVSATRNIDTEIMPRSITLEQEVYVGSIIKSILLKCVIICLNSKTMRQPQTGKQVSLTNCIIGRINLLHNLFNLTQPACVKANCVINSLFFIRS